MGHLRKISKVVSDAEDIDGLLEDISYSGFPYPGKIQDMIIIYDSFPVFGEFMFPKTKSHLWGLLESTDGAMLITDSLLQSADSLIVCQAVKAADAADAVSEIIQTQSSPAVCVNSFRGITAVMFRLNSIAR